MSLSFPSAFKTLSDLVLFVSREQLLARLSHQTPALVLPSGPAKLEEGLYNNCLLGRSGSARSNSRTSAGQKVSEGSPWHQFWGNLQH